jgi:hypothetical protein
VHSWHLFSLQLVRAENMRHLVLLDYIPRELQLAASSRHRGLAEGISEPTLVLVRRSAAFGG